MLRLESYTNDTSLALLLFLYCADMLSTGLLALAIELDYLSCPSPKCSKRKPLGNSSSDYAFAFFLQYCLFFLCVWLL
uniref:Uncharacterized protein MANES_10G080400 n=1 Tax=Rhizophora mucronata TaxID=61149 RepID=A0A2P2JM47_RHIMU